MNNMRIIKNSFVKKEKKVEEAIPNLEKGKVRIIPLGGVEEVGKNMCLVEYQDDILVFDAGFQFVGEETPGLNYIIPNTKYLEDRKHKIKGLIITHGHLDHIGGIPFIIEKLGCPPIYSTNLTSIMIKKRFEEYPHIKKPQMNLVENGQQITVGNTKLEFFSVTHSIPECVGVSVKTEHGDIVITGDVRLEHENQKPVQKEEEIWSRVGKNNNLVLFLDSTRAESEGWSVDEKVVYEKLAHFIEKSKDRVIIATFASQFERILKIIELTEQNNKKIIIEGRSIKTNVEVAKLAEYFKIKKETIITAKESLNYPKNKIIILSTGGQGERFSALDRMSRDEHKYVKLTDRDTVILSSSVIPGNEMNIQSLKDRLNRKDLTIISSQKIDVHAGGHGHIEELKWINKKVGAKFFMPAYGSHSMIKAHRLAAMEIGYKKEEVIISDNGSIIDINQDNFDILPVKAPANMSAIDGFSIGEINERVIADRQALSQNGFIVVIINVNRKTKTLYGSPDIFSRGFIFLNDSRDILKGIRSIIKQYLEHETNYSFSNIEIIKKDLFKKVSRFIIQKTGKEPIIGCILNEV